MDASSRTPTGPGYQAFGVFIRSQRELAQLTLRQAAELARISNPYLSQIEHGLSLPSITVMGALADALSVSAETLFLRAIGLAPGATDDVHGRTEDAIRQDPRLSIEHKQALLTVLASFTAGPSPVAPVQPPRKPRARKAAPNPTTKGPKTPGPKTPGPKTPGPKTERSQPDE